MGNLVEFGEVSALPTAQRRFVLAFKGEVRPGPDAAMEAARIAGYEDQPGNPLRLQAAGLLKGKAIFEALKELGCAGVPAAIRLQSIREVMDTPYSKDRLKAARLVLDRFMPATQKSEVKAEVVNREEVTLTHLKHLVEIGAERAALIREFGEFGLSRYTKLLERAPRGCSF